MNTQCNFDFFMSVMKAFVMHYKEFPMFVKDIWQEYDNLEDFEVPDYAKDIEVWSRSEGFVERGREIYDKCVKDCLVNR